MKLAEGSSHEAWQPFTPRGVAAFANAAFRRVLLVQLIFAALAGIAVTTFLASAWFPTVSDAIQKLPDQGYIRGGQLVYTAESPRLLASSSWLSITVDLPQGQTYRTGSDVQAEFSSKSVRFISLAGYWDTPYPSGWIIAFNQPELGSWWNAWEPFLAAGAGLIFAVGLMGLWAFLALIYGIPAGVICRFVEHDIHWRAVWKLCCAGQLPGSLLMSFTLLLYSLRAIDLVQWLFVFVAHVVVGWVYIFLSTFFIPRTDRKRSRKPNPFGG